MSVTHQLRGQTHQLSRLVSRELKRYERMPGLDQLPDAVQAAAAQAMNREYILFREIQDLVRTIGETLDAITEMVCDAEDSVRAANREKDLARRRQKRWRVVACYAVLGLENQKSLLHEALNDTIDTPPTHDELDEQLGKAIELMEQSQQEADGPNSKRRIELRV